MRTLTWPCVTYSYISRTAWRVKIIEASLTSYFDKLSYKHPWTILHVESNRSNSDFFPLKNVNNRMINTNPANTLFRLNVLLLNKNISDWHLRLPKHKPRTNEWKRDLFWQQWNGTKLKHWKEKFLKSSQTFVWGRVPKLHQKSIWRGTWRKGLGGKREVGDAWSLISWLAHLEPLVFPQLGFSFQYRLWKFLLFQSGENFFCFNRAEEKLFKILNKNILWGKRSSKAKASLILS